jgi:hypothetical protein
MKASFLSVLFALCLGTGVAYGQPSGSTQSELPGGTCSGYAAGCDLNCDQLETPSKHCHVTCANKLDACMQSGMWHNMDGQPDVMTNRQ